LNQHTLRQVLEQCCQSKVAVDFPPPLEYRRRFLKELARAAEASCGGDDGVMEALGELLVLPMSQVTSQPKSGQLMLT
jgi:hypothetical protein